MQKKNDIEILTIEELLEKLNQILKKLEDENLPIEKAVELFTQGAEINKTAKKKLQDLQQRVNIIKKDIDGAYNKEKAKLDEED